MDWAELEKGETVLWQGRPAPRCYTFRLWKQALAGSVLLLLSSFWLLLAWQLIKDGHPLLLAFFPLPLILGSFVFGPLQILLARWRWPAIFYLLTDQRLLTSCGHSVALGEIVDIKVKRQGEHLMSLRLDLSGSEPVVLRCVERPENLISLLHKHCRSLSV